MNSWRNLSLILLSTVAVVADAGDSMHGGWQPATRYSYWIPPLPEPNAKCIGETKLRVGLKGEFSCLVAGEALCRDNAENIKEGEEGGKFGFWRFGIDEVELDNGSTTGVVTMWDPRTNAVFTDFVGATHLCIGEIRGNDDPSAYSEERPWLIVYDGKRNDYMATLLCDGAEASLWDGTESKRTQLKMVNNQDIDRYTSYPVSVLKLKKGNTKDPNDDDALWKINYNADQTTDVVYNQDFCRWKVHTEQPSVAPSDLPSLSPSMQPSLRPSAASPSPSQVPSSHPSLRPSGVPSGSPTTLPHTTP